MAKHYFKATTCKNKMVICFDYRFEKCYKDGDDLVITYKDKEMIIPHSEMMSRRLIINPYLKPSKYGKPYHEYHFIWKPTDKNKEEEKDEQLKLF